MAVRGWKDLLEGREGLGGYPRGPGEVGRYSQRAVRSWGTSQRVRRDQKAIPEGQEGSGGFPVGLKGLGGTGGVQTSF